MSDQLSEIYFYALDLGIPAEKYWELSINEIIDTMDSLQRQRKRKEKQKKTENGKSTKKTGEPIWQSGTAAVISEYGGFKERRWRT